MNGVIIKKAVLEDWKILQKLNNEVYLSDSEFDDKPAGYIAMSELKFDHRKSKYVEVENMGVTPEYRSCGIGKLLVDKAKEWAKELGINKLFVVAYYSNQKAVKFYKREGFKEIGLELEMDI